jgi:hypothetical protein
MKGFDIPPEAEGLGTMAEQSGQVDKAIEAVMAPELPMSSEANTNKKKSVGLARGILDLFKEAVLRNDTIRGAVTSPSFAPAVGITSLIVAGLLHQGSEHFAQSGNSHFLSLHDDHFYDMKWEYLEYYLDAPEGSPAYRGGMDFVKSQVSEGGAAVAAGVSILSLAKWGKDKLFGRGQKKETSQGVVQEEIK